MRERAICGACRAPIDRADDLYLDQDGRAVSGHPILHRHDPNAADEIRAAMLDEYHTALRERGRDPESREDADLCRDALRGGWSLTYFRAYLDTVETRDAPERRIGP